MQGAVRKGLQERCGFAPWRPVLLCLPLALCACGNSEPLGGYHATVPANLSSDPRADAARFLTQATFGPKLAEIEQLAGGDYAAWIDQQMAAPPSYELPELQSRLGADASSDTRMEIWWRQAITGPDQLRQRMAYALSQILVISETADSELQAHPEAVAYYHDVLVRDAFGSFRQLMQDVTLAPAMGQFLNLLRNQKPSDGIRADENYARELMQLFTIGLVQLDQDGSVRRDGAGNPIPTFDQSQVEGLARAFTGWSFGSSGLLVRLFYGPQRWTEPMEYYEPYHDEDAKTILGGYQLPAGQDAAADLNQALDVITGHPNVGPFFGRQLIQRLVTSNPSPAYVRRVADVFANDGQGHRGNLGAVVKAILLDPEARTPTADVSGYGKLREPVLRVTQLWRAFDGRSASGSYNYPRVERELNQAPYRSPSVFNFYRPDYSPLGVLKDRGLVAPEFQIANESSSIVLSNALFTKTLLRNRSQEPQPADAVTISTAEFEPDAGDPDRLLDRLSLLLMSGQMSREMHATIAAHLASIPVEQAAQRVGEAIYLILSSPQYAVQR